MTPDLVALAIAALLCCPLVFALGIAEAQRFTDPRPAPRHRRRMSTSERVMEAREIIYTVGYACLGLYLFVIAVFALLMAGLHRLDAWRMRRFWGGQSVHS